MSAIKDINRIPSPPTYVEGELLHTAPRVLFIDMNSFFASVEQQEDPRLRGRPAIVAPLLAETTCALAASYEAKAYGIKTGTSVADARRMCPGLCVVEAQPKRYVEYHDRIIEVLNHYFVSIQPLSIDEMACFLSIRQRQQAQIPQLVTRIKDQIRNSVGECIRCSIGVAPNVFLAKVASDMQKPDGFTFFDERYPSKLLQLSLTDLPGIGSRMKVRLACHGIYTVEDLWKLTRQQMHVAWGGVLGDRWHYMLRGSLITDYGADHSEIRKTVSHSHVLAPELRTPEGARSIILRLAAKALRRLRTYHQAARVVSIGVTYRHTHDYRERYRWGLDKTMHLYADDDLWWLPQISRWIEELPDLPNFRPVKVSIYFLDLKEQAHQQLQFFDNRQRYSRLFRLIDALNKRYGDHTIEIAQALAMKDHAPFRIAFNVTHEEAP